MANLSTDIYDIAEVVDAIKAKYIDIPEDTLNIGIYGYLSEIFSNTIENDAIMAAEYANEAVPTKAKFERNVLSHALSLGINSIRATPAYMRVFLCIPENLLLRNLVNDRFTIDKYMDIKIGTSSEYSYRLDYDIVLHHNLLPNGRYVYTAMYDMTGEEVNEVTDIINPYLPALGLTNIGGTNLVLIPTIIRQIKYTEINKTILVDNPLENKTITFEFEDQLAYFNIMVTEGDKVHYLTPVYDGLVETTGKEFCNYMYINEKKIRVKFNRDSYQPRTNCTVIVNIYTTKGTECNFSYNEDKIIMMKSERFSYDANLYMMIRAISDSIDGKDRDSVEEIRRKIPKQMLMRGSVTTVTDLNNYFNFLNSEDRRLYFLEKIHNQIQRLYYSYLLLKSDEGNIVPTNTVDVIVDRDVFDSVNNVNYVLKPGKLFYYNPSTLECRAISTATPTEINNMVKDGFLYINPFLILVNKNPFFSGYYLTVLNYTKNLNFQYINQDCEAQFIASTIKMKREYFTKRDTYVMSLELEQNINNDFNLINTDSDGNIIECNVAVYAVIYVEGVAIRYLKGKLANYEDDAFRYRFEFTCRTDDIIDKNNRIAIEQGIMLQKETTAVSYLPKNVDMHIYVLAKLDNEYGRDKIIDTLVPNLDGYSLTNMYTVYGGIDWYYDYTDIMTSYSTISKNTLGLLEFGIFKMPLIRYEYMNSENRWTSFIKVLEKNRMYISSVLIILEDSFGIDFKFFNTYGPSRLYNIDNKNLLNRVNVSLKFELKYVMATDTYIIDDITKFIKEYMEDINDIKDLHMPNLITAVTNKFRNQLVYFKFIDINGYGPIKQSIYKENLDAFVENTTVPEFLNVHTLADDTPDIEYEIVD